ncbi:MAG: hypothetical protein ACXVGG_07110 [Mycobacteriaceae bacterium]
MAYYTSPITTADLGTYLGVTIDETRAQLLIDQAVALCESICSPLPDGSAAVVLDVAARACSNPTNVQSQGAGPFPVTYGPMAGGLWLTRQNKATLRRLNGSGGAFTIDTMPATAGQGLPWWDNNSWGYGIDVMADWDQTP